MVVDKRKIKIIDSKAPIKVSEEIMSGVRGRERIGVSSQVREGLGNNYRVGILNILNPNYGRIDELLDYAGKAINFVSATGIGLGAFLLYGSITGNVVYNLQQPHANILGLSLVFLGFLGLLLCTRRK